MESKMIEKIDNAYNYEKYKSRLQKCQNYLDIINSGFFGKEEIMCAEKFSLDTYMELFKDDSSVVLANTSKPRNVDLITNLVMNLEALKRMLTELIAKETEKSLKADS